MPGSIYVKLSEFVEGRWAIALGQKKIQNVDLEKICFFCFFLSTCNLTLSDHCTRDDSLGFEDCRLATHLLNLLR